LVILNFSQFVLSNYEGCQVIQVSEFYFFVLVLDEISRKP